MRSNQAGLNEALEQPALHSLLPNVTRARVIDLGCGDGALCRALVALGAARVTGVDPSARMLEVARARTADPRISYMHAFAEDASFEAGSAELVTSSLVLHYVSGTAFGVLLGRIATWLGRGGRIVASMEHPIVTAPRHRTATDIAIIDDYADQGPRSTNWFIDGVVKYHRTVSTILNTVIDAGLKIEHVVEPTPDEKLLRHRPDLERHRHRPPLLLVRAQRP
jgi:SAM-dependent methyltransferase